jgi:hypothetical protein
MVDGETRRLLRYYLGRCLARLEEEGKKSCSLEGEGNRSGSGDGSGVVTS